MITGIENSFSIAKSELNIGDRITEINSKSVEIILSNLDIRPPHNQRNYTFLRTEEILRNLYGFEQSIVTLKYLDSNNVEKTISAELGKRNDGQTLFEGFPDVFLDNSNKIYHDSIGYISFNAFQPSDANIILNLINRYKNLPSLIIDLRGNNGGSIDAIRNISSQLLKNSNVYYNITSKNSTTRFEVQISNNSYKGKLVILVDELSISAAEIFADLFQITNSAIIIGEQTPGNVLSGELFYLSNGYNLLLPVSNWIRNDGNKLEGIGVIPDYTVKLSKSDLFKGIDTQLEFAINLCNRK